MAARVGAPGVGGDPVRASAVVHRDGDAEASRLRGVPGALGGRRAGGVARAADPDPPWPGAPGDGGGGVGRGADSWPLGGARPGAPGDRARAAGGGSAVEYGGRALAPAGLQGGLRLPAALLHLRRRAAPGLCAAGRRRAGAGGARPLDRVGRPGPPGAPGAGAQQQPLPDLSPRRSAALGQPCAGTTGAPRACGLAGTLGVRAPVAGDLRRSAPLRRHLLPRRRVGVARSDQRAGSGPTRPDLSQHPPPGVGQAPECGLAYPPMRQRGQRP